MIAARLRPAPPTETGRHLSQAAEQLLRRGAGDRQALIRLIGADRLLALGPDHAIGAASVEPGTGHSQHADARFQHSRHRDRRRRSPGAERVRLAIPQAR